MLLNGDTNAIRMRCDAEAAASRSVGKIEALAVARSSKSVTVQYPYRIICILFDERNLSRLGK
jgi:hypothetical protein